jgi:hypothetical protein
MAIDIGRRQPHLAARRFRGRFSARAEQAALPVIEGFSFRQENGGHGCLRSER